MGICWIIIMLRIIGEPLTKWQCRPVQVHFRLKDTVTPPRFANKPLIREPPASYPLVFYIANWKITIFKFRKSSFSSFVSMGHGFHSKLLNNQRVMNHFVVGAYILSVLFL